MKIGRTKSITATCLFMAVVAATGATMTSHAQNTPLNIGDPAPEFQGTNHEGETWKSSDHKGEILVVFFFPAAMTGGCTAQACSFRDNRTRLTELGAEVVGISGDRVEGLEIFRRAHNLNFPLVSDSEGRIAGAFGVPVRDGGTFIAEVDGEQKELVRDLTTARWTFVIDKDGNIAHVDTEVDAEGDSEAVIAAIRKMES
ncbi:peroxiredoxin [Balneolales bacterium ANBcel1]|nr:peroxiredoxin [Balneolales bacterium ANBcel1]